MNYLQLPSYFMGYYTALQKEKKFIHQHLKPLVDYNCAKLNYTLSKSDEKKILTYYPCFTVLAGGENFLLLKNRALSFNERWRLTIVSAMSSLCDDLIDEEHWSADQLLQLLDLNLAGLPMSPKTKIILALNDELYQKNKPSKAYESFLKTAIEWQAASLKQLNASITTEEIIQISKEKNGNTSMMFAHLLDEEWTANEKEIIHQSGYLGQLVNDSYDVFKDINGGVNTYMQRMPTIETSEKFFLGEWKKLVSLINASNALPRNKKNLINRFACMHGYAITAFKQFRLIEQKQGAPVDWKKASRKELVVDMELWPTRFSLLQSIKRLSNIQ